LAGGMSKSPASVGGFYSTPAAVKAAKALLRERGVEIIDGSNVYELIRFRSKFGVGVVYRNESGSRKTPNDAAAETFKFLLSGGAGSLAPVRVATRKSGPKAAVRRRHQLAAVFERDGGQCFYCACGLSIDVPVGAKGRATREHLVPVTAGGPDVVANIFAACEPCNAEAGHLSAPEKVALRDRKRGFGAAPLTERAA
jgi:hypothetical protein